MLVGYASNPFGVLIAFYTHRREANSKENEMEKINPTFSNQTKHFDLKLPEPSVSSQVVIL